MSIFDILSSTSSNGGSGSSSGGIFSLLGSLGNLFSSQKSEQYGPPDSAQYAASPPVSQPTWQNTLQKLNTTFQPILQPLVQNEQSAKLQRLAFVAPSIYGQAAAQAAANEADPLQKLRQQSAQLQIAKAENPDAFLSTGERLENQARATDIDRVLHPDNYLSALDKLKQTSAEQEIRKNDLEQQRQQAIMGIFSGQNTAPNNAQTSNVPPSLAPLSVRNNNPGNMKNADGSFQQFSDPSVGLNAMSSDLSQKISGNSPAMEARYGKGYSPTLSNLVNVWAPPTENNTQAYVDNVSRETGIQPNQVLTQADVAKLTPALIKQEGGTKAATFYNQPTQTVSEMQQAGQAPNPYTAELSRADKLRQLDPKYQDNYDTLLSKSVEWDQKNAKNLQNSQSVITPDNENLRGQDFINTIQDPDVRNKAQALIEGRAPYPNITSRTPSNIKLALEAAQQADPTYSAATAPVRTKTLQAYANGQEAKNFNAINTTFSHLADYLDNSQKINNFDYGGRGVNFLKNEIDSNISPNHAKVLNNLNIAKGAVGSEVAKAYQGVGAVSEGQQKDWQSALSANQGPTAAKGATQEIATLLVGKINALQNQYQQTFPGSTREFLSSQAKQDINKLGLDAQLGSDGQYKVVPFAPQTASGGWSIRAK